jgi:hypothetical protein
MQQSFSKGIDWQAMEEKQVKPADKKSGNH